MRSFITMKTIIPAGSSTSPCFWCEHLSDCSLRQQESLSVLWGTCAGPSAGTRSSGSSDKNMLQSKTVNCKFDTFATCEGISENLITWQKTSEDSQSLSWLLQKKKIFSGNWIYTFNFTFSIEKSFWNGRWNIFKDLIKSPVATDYPLLGEYRDHSFHFNTSTNAEIPWWSRRRLWWGRWRATAPCIWRGRWRSRGTLGWRATPKCFCPSAGQT